jgi:alpha-tubulin suppressor-like RCC1 family protein
MKNRSRNLTVALALLVLSTLILQLSTALAAPTVTQVSAGEYHTIFVKSDGSLWGMGDNSYGELGQGFSLGQTNLPLEIINTNVTAIAAGSGHTLFLESNGSLWAMGYNDYGQLGDGTANNHYFPEQIVSSEVTGVAAGYDFSHFTTYTPGERFGLPTYALWAMGDNSSGQLGDNSLEEQDSPEQIQSTEFILDAVTGMPDGYAHSLIVEEGGSLWGTGDDLSRQLGLGESPSNGFFYLTYSEIVSNNVTAAAAGWFHSLFITSAGGGLWAMGDDSHGELGDNSTVQKDSPEQVGFNVTTIAAGNKFSLFIESDGSLWGMGENDSGQLGDGTGIDRHVPVQIAASNVVAIAAGAADGFFIKSDGTLWAMGDNSYGQLGDGTVGFDRLSPVQVVPLVIPQPVMTGVSLANTNLVLSGNNGESGRTYYLLMSKNLAQPLNQWTPIATNFLATDGAFTFTATNTVVPNAPQAFYILQAQ